MDPPCEGGSEARSSMSMEPPVPTVHAWPRWGWAWASTAAPGGVACGYFTACEASVLACAVHTAAPILLGCAAARLTRAKTEQPAQPAGSGRSRVQLALLALCVLFDGVAAALPLLSHVVPGMITLTGQVAAVSGAASWSATCALLLVLFSVEYSLDCTRAVVLWALADTFAGALSIADAACGGIGAAGVLWRSAGAMLVLASVAARLLLLLLFPRLGAAGTAETHVDADLDDETSGALCVRAVCMGVCTRACVSMCSLRTYVHMSNFTEEPVLYEVCPQVSSPACLYCSSEQSPSLPSLPPSLPSSLLPSLKHAVAAIPP